MSIYLILAEAHKHPTWADFGPVEWVAVVVAGIGTLWTVWKAVMYTLEPGEDDANHIKRSILFDELLQATAPSEDDLAVAPSQDGGQPDHEPRAS